MMRLDAIVARGAARAPNRPAIALTAAVAAPVQRSAQMQGAAP